jgi:hypothetical protein
MRTASLQFADTDRSRHRARKRFDSSRTLSDRLQKRISAALRSAACREDCV